MKSLVKKADKKIKAQKVKNSTAQCCAKTSKNIPGCHD
jgi:hypothetical protein